MARWQHQYNDHELGQTSGNDEGQGGLSCVVQGICKETDTTGRLNNNNQVNKMTRPLGIDQSFLSYLVFIQWTLASVLISSGKWINPRNPYSGSNCIPTAIDTYT